MLQTKVGINSEVRKYDFRRWYLADTRRLGKEDTDLNLAKALVGHLRLLYAMVPILRCS